MRFVYLNCFIFSLSFGLHADGGLAFHSPVNSLVKTLGSWVKLFSNAELPKKTLALTLGSAAAKAGVNKLLHLSDEPISIPVDDSKKLDSGEPAALLSKRHQQYDQERHEALQQAEHRLNTQEFAQLVQLKTLSEELETIPGYSGESSKSSLKTKQLRRDVRSPQLLTVPGHQQPVEGIGEFLTLLSMLKLRDSEGKHIFKFFVDYIAFFHLCSYGIRNQDEDFNFEKIKMAANTVLGICIQEKKHYSYREVCQFSECGTKYQWANPLCIGGIVNAYQGIQEINGKNLNVLIKRYGRSEFGFSDWVKRIGVFYHPHKINIISICKETEFCVVMDMGELKPILVVEPVGPNTCKLRVVDDKTENNLSKLSSIKNMLGLAEVIQGLHWCDVCHGCINFSTIFLNCNNDAVITNFNQDSFKIDTLDMFSTAYDLPLYDYRDPDDPLYFQKKADIYKLGLLFACARANVLSPMRIAEIRESYHNGDRRPFRYYDHDIKILLDSDKQQNTALREIIEGMIKPDPKERSSLENVIKSLKSLLEQQPEQQNGGGVAGGGAAAGV